MLTNDNKWAGKKNKHISIYLFITGLLLSWAQRFKYNFISVALWVAHTFIVKNVFTMSLRYLHSCWPSAVLALTLIFVYIRDFKPQPSYIQPQSLKSTWETFDNVFCALVLRCLSSFPFSVCVCVQKTQHALDNSSRQVKLTKMPRPRKSREENSVGLRIMTT